MKAQGFRKYSLIVIGSVSLALGIIGVFIPVLPTTPFLLLASSCYIRSSERLYGWLVGHRVFGQYIHDYVTHKAVRRGTKIAVLAALWLTLAISAIAVEIFHIRLLLLAVGIGVSIHISTLKTLGGGKKDRLT